MNDWWMQVDDCNEIRSTDGERVADIWTFSVHLYRRGQDTPYLSLEPPRGQTSEASAIEFLSDEDNRKALGWGAQLESNESLLAQNRLLKSLLDKLTERVDDLESRLGRHNF